MISRGTGLNTAGEWQLIALQDGYRNWAMVERSWALPGAPVKTDGHLQLDMM